MRRRGMQYREHLAEAAPRGLDHKAELAVDGRTLEKAPSKAPAHRLVSIDDVGAATAFLALDAARLITGATLYIDGGYDIID
jgi:enoyl-[acyl-carrier-protein] reductase (NADH)